MLGYDPYQEPPDIEMAVEHGVIIGFLTVQALQKAKRVYSHIKEDKYKAEKKKACPCCGLATVIDF